MSIDEAHMQRLVQEWQGFVYSIALRMLGRSADAEDATQEVFRRVLERPEAYDPARDFKPWIARVTRNVVLNRIRADKTRQAKTEAAESAREAMEDPLDRSEREEVVQAQLAELPEDARLLLTLHYYGGLNKTEVSEVLDIPRTTVQTRLASALERMKSQLVTAGYAGLAPVVDGVMQSAAPAPVPAGLARNLTALAAKTAGASAAAAGLVIGGVVVTKNLIIAAAVLVALSAGGGFVAAHVTAGALPVSAPERGSLLDSDEVARLEAENTRLAQRLAELEDAGPGLASRGTPRTSEPAQPSATKGPDEPKARPAAPVVDFTRFANLWAASLDKVATLKDTNWDDLSKEDQAQVMAILGALQAVGMEAQSKSTVPFFDRRILPDYIDAIFGPSIELSDASRAALKSRAAALIDAELGSLDVETAPPSQVYEARLRVAQGISDHVRESTPAAKKERAALVDELSRDLLRGGHQMTEIGIRTETDRQNARQVVLDDWKKAFGLTSDQVEAAKPLAIRLIEDAGDLLSRSGAVAGSPEPDAQTKAALDAGFLRLQVRAEAAIHRGLTKAQREDLGAKQPVLLRFFDGEGHSRSFMEGGGI